MMDIKGDWRDSLRSIMPEGYEPEPEKEEPEQPGESAKPMLRVELDRKRAGKIATIVSGFEPDDPRPAQLAAIMKKKLGIGGSERDGEILLQGDCLQRAADMLKSLGYKVKLIK